MSELGVVHLVRARNGMQPFTNFLDAYARNQGGVAHDLLILYKGFSGDTQKESFRKQLRTIPHKELAVSDLGVDLRAYSVAGRRFDYTYLCFLNSYCTPLDENWLAKMYALVRQPQVGVVGCTGSWESMYTNFLNARAALADLSLPGRLKAALRMQINRRVFLPFPNHHIRTNALVLSRKLMLEVWPRHIVNKTTAYLFENGRNSFTQRIMRRGLKPLVVGRDGKGYEKEDWARSNTFRQSNQEDLLVADNQTRNYESADFETRKRLSEFAWGKDARPAQP
jgi:hypothetical protein